MTGYQHWPDIFDIFVLDSCAFIQMHGQHHFEAYQTNYDYENLISLHIFRQFRFVYGLAPHTYEHYLNVKLINKG